MTDNDVSYVFKSVRTIRGTESRSISKWQKQGWEFVGQDHGKLRTTLTFRREKPNVRRIALMVGGALTLLALVIGIGIAAEDDDQNTIGVPATKVSSVEPESSTPSESPSPTEAVAVLEPSPQEVWVANYNANLKPYVAAVTTALAMRFKKVDAPAGALNACQLMSKEQPLDKRVGQARKAFTGTSSPTYDEALGAIDATATTICPEFATFHESQTAERAKQLRAEEKKRKERERRREEAAAAQAARDAEEARKLVEQQEPDPVNVSYANCTEVENAGAAPISSGDPGYGPHLDRDGDGIACEQ